MAAKTTDADPAIGHPSKISSMTKGTRILDIGCRIMERVIWAGPGGRVCVVDAVTSLTAGTVNTIDAKVKTGITPRSAGLSMAGLACRQVGLGIRAMICTIKIGAIHWMRRLAGAVGMAAETGETVGEAAGSRRTAQQVSTMACGARGGTIGRGISTMVDERVYPSCRVNNKRWCVVVGVAGIAADRLADSLQVCTMADEAVCESGNSQGICRMRLDPIQRVR